MVNCGTVVLYLVLIVYRSVWVYNHPSQWSDSQASNKGKSSQNAADTEPADSAKACTPGTCASNTTEGVVPDKCKEVSVPAPPSTRTSSTLVIDKYLCIGPFKAKVVQVNIL